MIKTLKESVTNEESKVVKIEKEMKGLVEMKKKTNETGRAKQSDIQSIQADISAKGKEFQEICVPEKPLR